jgi:hypothetical protein
MNWNGRKYLSVFSTIVCDAEEPTESSRESTPEPTEPVAKRWPPTRSTVEERVHEWSGLNRRLHSGPPPGPRFQTSPKPLSIFMPMFDVEIRTLIK